MAGILSSFMCSFYLRKGVGRGGGTINLHKENLTGVVFPLKILVGFPERGERASRVVSP